MQSARLLGLTLLILALAVGASSCARPAKTDDEGGAVAREPRWATWERRALKASELAEAVSAGWGALGGESGTEPEVWNRFRGLLYVEHAYYVPRKEDVPALVKVLKDEHQDICSRLCIARYLLDLDVPEARQFVEQCLRSRSVMGEAVEVLVWHVDGDASKVWAIRVMADLVKDRRLWPESGHSSEDAEWALWRICRELGQVKCKEAVPALMDLLKEHPDSWTAAEALGEIGDPRAATVLLRTVSYRSRRSGKVQLRRRQTEALGRLGCRQAVPVLIDHLDDDDVIDALGKIGDQRAVGPLRKYLQRAEGRDYTAARIALARLEGRDVGLVLIDLLTKVAWPRMIVWELERLREKRAVRPLLKLARTSKDELTITDAIHALGEISGEEAVEGLVGLFDLDFQEVEWAKGGRPEFMYIAIGHALEKATGERFDIDLEWKAWLERRQKGEGAASQRESRPRLTPAPRAPSQTPSGSRGIGLQPKPTDSHPWAFPVRLSTMTITFTGP